MSVLPLATVFNYSSEPPAVLHMHFDEAGGATSFADSSDSAHTVTTSGGAVIDGSSSPFASSPGCARFDGSGDALSIPNSNDWRLWEGDFTIETRANLSSISRQSIANQWSTSNGPRQWLFQFSSTGFPEFFYKTSNGSTNGISITSSVAVTIGQWHHILVSRVGADVYLLLDGILRAQQTNAATTGYDFGSTSVAIGQRNNADWLNGCLKELRILKGTARHTANFTPPTAPYN